MRSFRRFRSLSESPSGAGRRVSSSIGLLQARMPGCEACNIFVHFDFKRQSRGIDARVHLCFSLHLPWYAPRRRSDGPPAAVTATLPYRPPVCHAVTGNRPKIRRSRRSTGLRAGKEDTDHLAAGGAEIAFHAVHGDTIIPDYQIALPPAMPINEARMRRVGRERIQQRVSFLERKPLDTVDTIGVEIDRLSPGYGMGYAPAGGPPPGSFALPPPCAPGPESCCGARDICEPPEAARLRPLRGPGSIS